MVTLVLLRGDRIPLILPACFMLNAKIEHWYTEVSHIIRNLVLYEKYVEALDFLDLLSGACGLDYIPLAFRLAAMAHQLEVCRCNPKCVYENKSKTGATQPAFCLGDILICSDIANVKSLIRACLCLLGYEDSLNNDKEFYDVLGDNKW